MMRDGAAVQVRRRRGPRGDRAAARALIPAPRRGLDIFNSGGRRETAAAPLPIGALERADRHIGMVSVLGRGEGVHGDVLRLTLHASEDGPTTLRAM